MSFDIPTRRLLAKTVTACRGKLTEDITDQLRGVYGLHPDGTVLPLEKLTHLSPDQAAAAQNLRVLLDHYTAGEAVKESDRPKAAYERMVLEMSFTVLNRLAALRLCEERGLVVECVRKGTKSDGFQMFERISGGVLGGRYDTYRVFLECLFDELALDLGVLFDRMTPQSTVFPTERCMEDILAYLNKQELSHLWSEDETIGWVYQYFNPKEERDVMRNASRSPQNSRELAVRNQFFTPRYVVEFLTDNTLGRIWYEMNGGATKLKDECRYLVRRPNEVFLSFGEKASAQTKEIDLSQEELLNKPDYVDYLPKKDPRDLRVLDPACGSGHFLLYAFDLLECIYLEAWDDVDGPKSLTTENSINEDFKTLDDLRRAIPKLIIEYNLHGIDIDSRAVQIAVLALWLRAQKSWKNLGIKAVDRPHIQRSNIVTAEPMPGEEDMRREFTAGLKPAVLGQLVEVVFDKMKLAGEAGSLLMIEEEIKEAVAKGREEWLEGPKPKQQDLFQSLRPKQQEQSSTSRDITDERFWDQAEDRILDTLKSYSEMAENGHAIRRRLFASDAARGFAFIDLCRNRYDVILMNPPFGAASSASKKYIESRYPKTKGDVLANFIERALHLSEETGRVGAITNRTPFFLSSFETLRTGVLEKAGHIQLMADLGAGVLEAMVETASYVMSKPCRGGRSESLFFRLLVDTEKEDLLKQLIDECLVACVSDRTYVINPKHFESLNGSPYAYWVSRSTIEKIGEHPCIEGNNAAIRVGLQTGEDFRHLRLLWEIPNKTIVPYLPIKGESGLAIREQCIDQLNNGGLWVPFSKTEIASPWFSPITMAVHWAKDGHELKNFTNSKGKVRSRPQNEDYYFLPGFSYMGRCTRLVPYLVPAGVMPTARRAQIFPKQGQEYTILAVIASNIGSAVARFRGEMFARPNFQAGMVQGLPGCDFPEEVLALVKEYVDGQVNKRRALVQHYEPFQEFSMPAWIQQAEEGDTAWDLYSLFGRDLENKIADAFGLNQEELAEVERDIREAVSVRGKMEDADPEDTDEESDEEQELNIELISETSEEKAFGLIQYAVGVVFGRWDVRISLNPSLAPKLPAPFDPLPVCPPAMLIGPDGLPATPEGIVSEEWMRARPDANSLPQNGSVQNPTIPDSDYPIRISWDGILVDDPGIDGSHPHRDDIVSRVRDVFDVIWKNKAHEVELEVCEALGVSDLTSYFKKTALFFQEHKTRYSAKRGRKAPIYWPLSTMSGSYTLWLYYQHLTDQTLYAAVNKYLDPKIGDVERAIAYTENELKTASGQSISRLTDQINEDLTLLGELRDLREELLRIAALPFKPNLSDGVIINAAPFHKLFRQRAWAKDTGDCWKKLAEGEYDWTHLAYTIWPGRVRDVCKRDRSIAIAHGLEDLCEVEVQASKKKGGQRKDSRDRLIL